MKCSHCKRPFGPDVRASETEGLCRLCEMLVGGAPVPGGTGTTGWPLESKALAVHPSQVAEANARNKKHGVAVVYKPNGRAHIPSRAARRDLLRVEGMHDNHGGYGD